MIDKLSSDYFQMKGNAASKSPTIQDAALTSTVLNEPETSQDRQKNNGKISERVRKKSWYNVIYPSYKTRSQTFKKLFKDVPNDERLVVGRLNVFKYRW